MLSAAVATANHEGSVHYVVVEHAPSATQDIEGVVGSTDGEEIATQGADRLTILVKGNLSYVQASAPVLVGVLGLTSAAARSVAGKWVVVARGDKPFASLLTGVRFAAVLRQFTPTGALSAANGPLVSGHHTVVITGGLAAGAPTGASGSLSVTVLDTSPHLLVRGSVTVTNAGGTVTQFAVFDSWGILTTFATPPHAASYASLVRHRVKAAKSAKG